MVPLYLTVSFLFLFLVRAIEIDRSCNGQFYSPPMPLYCLAAMKYDWYFFATQLAFTYVPNAIRIAIKSAPEIYQGYSHLSSNYHLGAMRPWTLGDREEVPQGGVSALVLHLIQRIVLSMGFLLIAWRPVFVLRNRIFWKIPWVNCLAWKKRVSTRERVAL